MMSILIPVYNFDVRALVQDLHRQGVACGIEFEIICLDDGSQSEYKEKNRSLKELEHLRYEELTNNVGRSKIRNLLAQRAAFDYLLFMDCDSAVEDENYLERYIQHLNPEILLYGGRVYQTAPPSNLEYLLHWTYGTQREQQTANARKLQPYHSFMTNNFLIPKKIMLETPFLESLTGYGHEDTLFGFELRRKSIPIIHLENPLRHVGLETATDFLRKSKQGIRNLYFLEIHYPGQLETRLLNTYRRLNKSFLASFFIFILALLEQSNLKNLRGFRPNMRRFDLLKLYWLLQQSKA